jgi:hypothetical protein
MAGESICGSEAQRGKMLRQIVFYLIRLPSCLLLLVVGLLIDAVMSWPFFLLCALDPRCRRARTPRGLLLQRSRIRPWVVRGGKTNK